MVYCSDVSSAPIIYLRNSKLYIPSEEVKHVQVKSLVVHCAFRFITYLTILQLFFLLFFIGLDILSLEKKNPYKDVLLLQVPRLWDRL